MATTTINQTLTGNYSGSISETSVFSNFISWCKAQQNERLLWLGIILTGHGCVLTPITLFAIVMAGTNFTLFVIAIIAMGITVVANLAAMPTKVTIPVFILSIVVDIVLIISSIAIGWDVSNTNIG